MAKKTKEVVMSELDALNIKYDAEAKYDDLVALLDASMDNKPPADDKATEQSKATEVKPAVQTKPVEQIARFRPIKEIVAELKRRGIPHNDMQPYGELAELLNPTDKTLPKQKSLKVVEVKDNQVDLPSIQPVPMGIGTMQDHERRITACEIALGLKKVEETLID